MFLYVVTKETQYLNDPRIYVSVDALFKKKDSANKYIEEQSKVYKNSVFKIQGHIVED